VVRLARELEGARDQLLGIVNIADDAILSVDADQRIRLFNQGAERVFGYRAEEVLGEPLDVLIPEAFRESHRQRLQHFAETAQTARRMDERREIVGLRRNGEVFPAEASISKTRQPDGRLLFTVILRDITARKQAERELRGSREELRQLTAHLVSVREQERARMATEIHDELGQSLTALKMGLAWLQHKLSGKIPEVGARIDDLLSIAAETMDTVRRLAIELRPPLLDELGFEAALEWQVQEFERRFGILCKLRLEVDLQALDERRAIAVFRILQEALTNVARHAQATRVDVAVRKSPRKDQHLAIEVQDDGCGFEPGKLDASGSLGLIGMRERACHCGGQFQIDSRPGQGTLLAITIPLWQD
jgi:PAS domain S-box-containing protein